MLRLLVLPAAAIVLILLPFKTEAFGLFSFWKSKSKNCECPDGTKVVRGQACTGGGLCLGTFRGNKYMVTPSGCTDSATPTCDGSDDLALSREWDRSVGSVDIPDVENISQTIDSSTVTGDINTNAIVTHPDTEPNSVAQYCYDMVYGGYDDWYLPSKSELTFLACKSSKSPGFRSYEPSESPGCAGDFGGKENIIKLNMSFYWSSSERTSSHAWSYTSTGEQDYMKSPYATFGIRCIRRY